MKIERLKAVKVKKAKGRAMLCDGGGLWLQVGAEAHVKSWLFRYTLNGRARAMGLGSVSTISLAEAREAAREARKLLLAGIDPLAQRDGERAQARAEAARAITFAEAGARYIDAHKAGWSNARHAAQWGSSLQAYAYPAIGALPVAAVDTSMVMKVLVPIWQAKTETASRVRGRIESILDWAKAQGLRTGENPALWRGHLENLLPKKTKVAKVEHHAALDYREVGAFMASLRLRGGVAARALEFTILTATRTGEAVGARWGEFALDHPDGPVWVIPPERMKARREHRVPLSPAAVAVVEAMRSQASGELVFNGLRAGADSLLDELRRMGHAVLTVHGFRSAFRDWVGESTSIPVDVAEAALAHTRKDRTESAYARGDLLAKRRKLMEAWAAYCAAPAKGGKVVQIRRASE